MSLFEIVMLLCFGFAWPFSIHKSWVSRKTQGKSLVFLVIVWIGYLAGIIHKALYSRDMVIFMYALNMTMVTADALLYLRNRALEKKEL